MGSRASASSHLLPPAAAEIGEAAVEAVAGHQDLVTCSPVPAKLRPAQEGEQLCVTAMHEPQLKTCYLCECWVGGREGYGVLSVGGDQWKCSHTLPLPGPAE